MCQMASMANSGWCLFFFLSHINFVLAKCLHVEGDEEIKKSSEINKQMFSFDKMEMQNK